MPVAAVILRRNILPAFLPKELNIAVSVARMETEAEVRESAFAMDIMGLRYFLYLMRLTIATVKVHAV